MQKPGSPRKTPGSPRVQVSQTSSVESIGRGSTPKAVGESLVVAGWATDDDNEDAKLHVDVDAVDRPADVLLSLSSPPVQPSIIADAYADQIPSSPLNQKPRTAESGKTVRTASQREAGDGRRTADGRRTTTPSESMSREKIQLRKYQYEEWQQKQEAVAIQRSKSDETIPENQAERELEFVCFAEQQQQQQQQQQQHPSLSIVSTPSIPGSRRPSMDQSQPAAHSLAEVGSRHALLASSIHTP
jgi:hypothetical protein